MPSLDNMEQSQSDGEVETSVETSSSAHSYRQTASKSVTWYDQMPPESRGVVIEMGSSHGGVGTQLNSSSGFSGVDCSILKKLVPERSHEDVAQLGGVKGIENLLYTDVHHGIGGDSHELTRRTIAFGTNSYREPPTKSFFHFVLEALSNPMPVALLVSAALLLVFGVKEHGPAEGWYEGGSIFVVVFLGISVSVISKFIQSRQIAELTKVRNNFPVEVVRNGRRQGCLIFEIVVGDIVCLSPGDQVPADGLFIDGHSLEVDECSMTGESEFMHIDLASNPFLISGTKVINGCAKMLVTAVGMNTSWGEVMSTINHDYSDEQTPLQTRLNNLTSFIRRIGMGVGFVVIVVRFLRYFTGNTEYENGSKEFNGSTTKADDIVNVVVGIIAAAVATVVVATPEGLTSTITQILAYYMRRMMSNDQAIVRHLLACETMGSVTTICTDKIGTLTLNKMKVTKFWQGKESMDGRSYVLIRNNVLELIHQGIGLNTRGSVHKCGISRTNLEFSGSPMEKAILSYAVLELNMDMEAVRSDCVILHVEAFNSEKRRSRVLMKKVEDNTIHVHWKGAVETILPLCSHYYDSDGNMKTLNDEERMQFNQILGLTTLQCIAFAHKQVSEVMENIQENELTLLGIAGLKDPCRPGVKQAIQECQDAGVDVKLITGDTIFTAKAIATECGILHPDQESNDGSMVEGVDFCNYTEEERMENVDKIRVMAMASPSDKLLLVQSLKQKGHVVAITGDDGNDRQALKEAHIGLSMGIQGTQAARESSDIIIMNDDFASITASVKWGRSVHNNAKKLIQFQLTKCVAVLVIILAAAASKGKTPITAAQLIWFNLIMDTLGGLALATENPEKDPLGKPPGARSDPLITNIMWRNIIGQALYQVAVILVLEFKGESMFHIQENVHDTLVFNTFVLCQVFNWFNARELERMNIFKGILENRILLVITGITVILQVTMVEFLNRLAHTERLGWQHWGFCVLFAAFSWPIGWLVKTLPVPTKPLLNHLSFEKCQQVLCSKLHRERNSQDMIVQSHDHI